MKKQWLGMMVVLCGLSVMASATVIQTNEQLPLYDVYPALTDDLINDGSPSLAGESSTGGLDCGSGSAMNDGQTAPSNFWTGYNGDYDNSWSCTYTLDTTANTNGYDISTIAVIGGWNSGLESDRSRIEFTVEYLQVGATEYSTLGYYDWDPATDGISRVTIGDDQGASILSGVIELKVTFGIGGMYREVDVTGSPTPEPATMSLLAVGGLTLLRRRKW